MPGNPTSRVKRNQSSSRSGTTCIVSTRTNISRLSKACAERRGHHSARPRQMRFVVPQYDDAVALAEAGLVRLHNRELGAVVDADDEFHQRPTVIIAPASIREQGGAQRL